LTANRSFVSLFDLSLIFPFHLLCKVSPPRDLSDDELLDCIEQGYGPRRREQVAKQLADYRKDHSCGAAAAQQLRQTYVRRLFDISVFMKELKGRFAQWYNRRHSRYGGGIRRDRSIIEVPFLSRSPISS
jgi:hypothetical protein